MKSIRLGMVAAAAAAGILGSTAAGAQTVTYTTTPAPVISIPGLTGFATTGAMMSGMSITATFTNFTQTLAWATTGAMSGGVSGSGWGLSLDGDSFATPWLFTDTNTDHGQLTHLTLNGTPGLTIFDRTSPSPGTDGSASGADFTVTSGCASCVIVANYSGQTAVGSAAAIGDIWQQLDLSFVNGTGPRTGFGFIQDTDNDSRFTSNAPEPETYALLLGGLGMIGMVARRRRAQDR